MTGSINALRAGLIAALALVLLEVVWHAWLAPAPESLFWPSLGLAVIPLIPGLSLVQTSLRRGVLVCGIVCLFYFAHGISELWSGTAPLLAAVLEILFALIVIGSLGWDARGYRRPKKTGDNLPPRA